MTVAFDAVDWRAIPDGAVALGYINGAQSRWSAEGWAKFPGALRITVDPSINDGDIYDCEPGNGGPHDAGPWAKRRNEAGVAHPCIYTMDSWLAFCKQSVADAGATGVVYWNAEPNGVDHVSPGCVGTQWGWHSNRTLPAQFAALNVDISTFDDLSWLGAQATPASASTPPTIPAQVYPPWPGRILQVNPSRPRGPFTSGADVQEWQAQMAHRGWHISVDGVYGPMSDAICRQFQSQKGLAVDGAVGPITWRASWVDSITVG